MTSKKQPLQSHSLMRLQTLLTIPLLIGTAGCFASPEITATSRSDAMQKCAADNSRELARAQADRRLAQQRPDLADSEHPDFWSDKHFRYQFLLDDEYQQVSLLSTYCKPTELGHRGYWGNMGYLEYLVRSDDEDSKVEKVITSYGYVWKED